MKHAVTALFSFALFSTAACGAFPKTDTSSEVSTDTTANPVNTPAKIYTCGWVSTAYDFRTYSNANSTPPVPMSGLTWHVSGIVSATGEAFTLSLDVDENDTPWISLRTSDGLTQETCPDSITWCGTTFTFQLVTGSWFKVTATTNGIEQTFMSED